MKEIIERLLNVKLERVVESKHLVNIYYPGNLVNSYTKTDIIKLLHKHSIPKSSVKEYLKHPSSDGSKKRLQKRQELFKILEQKGY